VADLVSNSEMAGFPGAPYAEAVLQAAGESIRDDCGWHIAPAVTETLEIQSTGPIVLIPSLLVTTVTAVRDAETAELVEGWSLDKRAGVLSRNYGWWPKVVEVDLTHGHESCPAGLKPAIAERARAIAAGGHVRQESLGSRSISITPLESAAARYALPPRP
tara:strand:+ start:440 stop:922 length:483 start_codon:yes stop_codon:yes gene_type:complete